MFENLLFRLFVIVVLFAICWRTFRGLHRLCFLVVVATTLYACVVSSVQRVGSPAVGTPTPTRTP
jgi:hypothetical protein